MSSVATSNATDYNRNAVLDRAMNVLSSRLHMEQSPGEWMEITQKMVDGFADITREHQWIHVNNKGARHGPFGTPIAQPRLILSIIPFLLKSAGPTDQTQIRIEGLTASLDYGFDQVRFPAPVPVGARVRARAAPKQLRVQDGTIEQTIDIVVELEGDSRSACAAEQLVKLIF